MPNYVSQINRADLLAILKSERLVRAFEGIINTLNDTLPADTTAVQAALSAHISDPDGAHQASAIGATPSGNLAGITVAAQLTELDAEKVPTTRTVNGKPLSADVVLSAADVGAGTVTGVSVVSANGFAGTATAGATPEITLTTTLTGLLKGDGTAMSAAASNTDYLPPNQPDATNPMFIGMTYIEQAAPVSKAAAATLTIAELLVGIIQYTGAAANLTLPTGTLIDAGLRVGAAVAADRAFDFVCINTGSGTATITTAAGLTLVGAMGVAAGASAQFRVRKTAANTFTVYRIA